MEEEKGRGSVRGTQGFSNFSNVLLKTFDAASVKMYKFDRTGC